MARLTPNRRAISRCASPPGTTGNKRLAGVVLGPGAGPFVGADDHARDTVVDAWRGLVDPDRLAGPAAGKVLQQVERAGEHVVGRQGHQRRQVDPVQDLGEAVLARSAALLAGQEQGGVAGVEQDHAALGEVGLDPLDRTRRQVRMVGRDRPVEQREQSEIVGGDVDRHRVRGLDRGPHRQDAGQALEPGLALLVDVRLPGQHVGEAGLGASARRSWRRRRRPGPAGAAASSASSRAAAPARTGAAAGQQPAQSKGDEEVDHRQQQCGEHQPRCKVALGGAGVGLGRAADGAGTQGVGARPGRAAG